MSGLLKKCKYCWELLISIEHGAKVLIIIDKSDFVNNMKISEYQAVFILWVDCLNTCISLSKTEL